MNPSDQSPHDFAMEPDPTSDLIDQLRAELAAKSMELELAQSERDVMQRKYTAALAEVNNTARRGVQSEQQARDMGVRSVMLNVLPVIDHFDFALHQDPSRITTESVISGVTMIKDELLKALATQGAQFVSPQPNDSFDPMMHEAVMQQPAEGIESGNVVRTLRMGFVLAGRTVRPAQVIVAP